MKIYIYSKCSTCKNAIEFLNKNKINYKSIDISQTPPSLKELQAMLKFQGGELRKLFNTSGMQYRELGIAQELPQMPEKQALELLAENGMLVKRPFLLGDNVGLVGFKKDQWHILSAP